MSITINGTTGISGVDGSSTTPAFQGNDTNTGIFFSAADTIDFAEGGTAVGQFDSSANFKFNSGYGSVATAFGCRMWIYFTVSSGTPSIGEDGNVTSITDNGAGDYTFNFTNNLPDTNYCVVGMGTGGGAFYQIAGGSQGSGLVKNVGSVRIQFGYVSSLSGALSNQDVTSGNIIILR
jgi:hypothetical protein